MKDEDKAKEILEKVSFNKYVGDSYLPNDDSERCVFTCGFVKRLILASANEMAEYKNAKMEKLRWLADEMYFRMQTLSTDLRPLRKAMEEYHNFIIHEYDE
jgi:hypothetical protein